MLLRVVSLSNELFGIFEMTYSLSRLDLLKTPAKRAQSHLIGVREGISL